MSKPPERIAALRKLAKKAFTLGDPLHIMEEMVGASDRALAIGCAAMVEDVLRSEIIRHMEHLDKNDIEKLFGVNAPLSSFSAKILIGYAMKIFGQETRSDLTIIREIRNVFAHSIAGLSFETKEIKDACSMLLYPKSTGLLDMRPPYMFGGFTGTMFFLTSSYLFSRFASPGQSDPDWATFRAASRQRPNGP